MNNAAQLRLHQVIPGIVIEPWKQDNLKTQEITLPTLPPIVAVCILNSHAATDCISTCNKSLLILKEQQVLGFFKDVV